MTDTFTFETIQPITGGPIPVHPTPSIFETTAVKVGRKRVDHVKIQEILDRPPWDFIEADDRLRAERIAALQVEIDKAVAKRPTKNRTTKKASPKEGS